MWELQWAKDVVDPNERRKIIAVVLGNRAYRLSLVLGIRSPAERPYSPCSPDVIARAIEGVEHAIAEWKKL
jgi:hypothetical protein